MRVKKWIITLLAAVMLACCLTPLLAVEAEAATAFQPVWPVSNGFVMSLDYYPGGSSHNGIDITPTSSAYNYQSIYAIASGTVIEARNSCSHETYNANHACPDTWGNYIIIKHTVNGVTYHSTYAHLKYNSLTVSVGDIVAAGQTIAQMGTSGGSTGHHLHLEIWQGQRGDRNQSIISRSFDYYMGNPSLPDGLKFNYKLASTSQAYSSWITNNCSRQGDYYVYEKGDSCIASTYPTYCTIEATASTSAMSMPCSTATNSDSQYLEAIGAGSLLTATELILNSAGNYWYKVQLDGYDEAYVPSSKMEFSWSKDDDVSISGVAAPQSLTEGSRFSIKGTITSTYNQLTYVSAYVYRGNTTSGTPVTGGRDTVSGNSYSLLNSDVDMDVLFNELTPGTYTYVVRAGYAGDYASTETTKGSYSGEIILHSSTFQVTGSGSSSADTYTISFNANGGSGAPGSIEVAYNETVTLPEQLPSRWGYNFLCWTTNGSEAYLPGDTIAVTADMVLYAYWETGGPYEFWYYDTSSCPINYAGYGHYSSWIPQQSGQYGIIGTGTDDTIAELYDASGNLLASDDDSGGNMQFLISYYLAAGETYYIYVRHYDTSKEESISFHIGLEGYVSYDANGGTGAPAAHATYWGLTTVSSTIPTRSGFTFVGWSTDEVVSAGDIYQPGEFIFSTGWTLYAVWSHECNFVLQSTTPATCSTAGRNYYECSLCGIRRTEEIPATGVHTDADGKWSFNELQHYHECACGTAFDFEYHDFFGACDTYCDVCGYTRTASHNWNSGTVTKQPTCAETGVKTYTCTVCGGKKTESLPKTNDHSFASWGSRGDEHIRCCFICGLEETGAHSWDSGAVTKQPTCKETGVKKYHCTVCNCPKTESIPKLSTHTYDNACDTDCNVCGRTRTTTHSWNSGTVTKQPTCAETGVKTYTCTVCRATKTETLSKTNNHSYGADWVMNSSEHWHECSVCGRKKDSAAHTPGAAATETTAQTCTACGYVIQAPLGHTHRYGEQWESNSSKHWHVCACGKKAEESNHSWDKGVVTSAASCRKEGVKTYTCTVCEETKTETIPVSNHSYSANTTAATCTDRGYTSYTCSVCGDSYTDDYVAALGHTEVVDGAVEATCTESGMSEGKHCSVCRAVLVAQNLLPAKGHVDENGDFACDICREQLCTVHTEQVIPGKAATCEQSGLTEGMMCSTCGEILQAQEQILALGHSYGEWIEVKAPTAEETGLSERVCSGCGAKEQKELDKLESVPTVPTAPETQPMEPIAPETQPAQTTHDTTGNTVAEPQEDANTIVVLIAVIAALGGIIIGGVAVLIVLKKKK